MTHTLLENKAKKKTVWGGGGADKDVTRGGEITERKSKNRVSHSEKSGSKKQEQNI